MVNKEKESAAASSILRTEVLSVGRHSLIYVVGQALSRGVGFFMIPIYTQYIAPSNYGAMELIEIIYSCIGIAISMGAAHGMWRYYRAAKSQKEQNQVISTIFIGFGLVGIPVVIFFIAFSGILARAVLDTSEYQYFLQVTFATVWFTMLCDFGFSYLRMLYMAKHFVVVTTIQLIIALSLNIWFVVFMKLDILGIFYSNFVAQGFIGVFLTIWILRKVGVSLNPKLLWKLLRFGIPLVPSRIGLMLGFVSNRFFLRWYSSPDPMVALALVGLYSLGHKFGVVISRFVNVPFNSFWAPRRMELLFNKETNMGETIARICVYTTICSIYLSLLISAGIESLIEIIADPRYIGAHVVVPFVALSYVILGLEHHFVAGILYKKKTIWSTYASVFSLAIILVCNYIFVPVYGLIGAVLSMVIGLTVRVAFIYVVSQHFYRIPFELVRILKLFACSFILYLISQTIILPSPYSTFFLRIGFVSLFPLVLYIIRFYYDSEVEFIFHLLEGVLNKVSYVLFNRVT